MMTNKKYILPVLFAVLFASDLFLFAGIVHAQFPPPPGPSGPTNPVNPGPSGQTNPPTPGPGGSTNPTPISLLNPLKVKTIAELLQLILDIVTIFAVPIIIFFIIYAGFLFVTAQGKPERLVKARNALLWSVIGGVIILGANVLLIIIQNTVKSLQ